VVDCFIVLISARGHLLCLGSAEMHFLLGSTAAVTVSGDLSSLLKLVPAPLVDLLLGEAKLMRDIDLIVPSPGPMAFLVCPL
jgi:hypothetical protein